MAELPKIISVDDHVLEPPNVWIDRLPAKYRDVGPRIERKVASNLQFNGTTYTYDLDAPDGVPTDFWVYEDLIMPHRRIIAAAGYPVDEVTLTPITYDDMRPGCYDAKARLEDMDINWVEASLSFPTFPRFCGQTFLEAKDRDLAMLCVRAYNDWMVEEWSAGTDGRLVPLCLIPLWDPTEAAAEVRRNAARGVPAVCFSEIPYHLGLPSIHDGEHWEPFFDGLRGDRHRGVHAHRVVVQDAGHLARRARPRCRPRSASTTPWARSATSCTRACWCATPASSWPTARARSAGCPTSWSGPTTSGTSSGAGPSPASRCPSRRRPTTTARCSAASSATTTASARSRRCGVDNITFEVDYPHSDSTWPNTKAVAEEPVRRAERRGHLQDRARQRHPHAPPRPRPLSAAVPGRPRAVRR